MEPIDLSSFLGTHRQGLQRRAPLRDPAARSRDAGLALSTIRQSRAIFLSRAPPSAKRPVATPSSDSIADGASRRATARPSSTADRRRRPLARPARRRCDTSSAATGPTRRATLPDFFGGAVGFVTYDYVRRLERLPREPSADMWPDVDFSFPGAVLICDHVQHSTTAVVNAVIEDTTTRPRCSSGPVDQLQTIIEATPRDRNRRVIPRRAARRHRARVSARRSTFATIAKGLSNFSAKGSTAASVERAREHVFAGDVFQVVPSQQFQRPSTGESPDALPRPARAQSLALHVPLDSGENQIVGASPEMLMRVHDGARELPADRRHTRARGK